MSRRPTGSRVLGSAPSRSVPADAGVRAELMRSAVAGRLGGFAGLFALHIGRCPRSLPAPSPGGVGTKLAVRRPLTVHDTLGVDLVATAVCGA